jgi:hypothetical protein
MNVDGLRSSAERSFTTAPTLFRVASLLLVSYFWWIGVGNFGSEKLVYLTNWVMTLNIGLAAHVLIPSQTKFLELFQSTYLSIASLNIFIVMLYWGLRAADPSFLGVDTTEWSIFYWIWDIYLHLMMMTFVLIEVLLLSTRRSSIIPAYTWLVVVFIAYIIYLEMYVSQVFSSPCGSLGCGFPYPFLNELDHSGRAIFYGGIWLLGSCIFIVISVCHRFINRSRHRDPAPDRL